MYQLPDHRELPPTAGLPLVMRDLLPQRAGSLTQALRNMLGGNDAWVTCSGTAALVVALTALSQHTRRREVIVPAWTCPLVAIAVAHCGLRLRLCDLRPDSIDMEPRMLEHLCGPATLAIIPTHVGGRVADVATANVIAAGCGAWVIEDAAQALGACHADGTPVGALADIGIFSLAAGKGLSIYEGGILTTRRADLHASIQRAFDALQPRRMGWELRRCIEVLGYAALYHPRGLRLAYGRELQRRLRHGDLTGAVGDRFPLRIPLHAVSRWRESVAARAALRLPGFLDALDVAAQSRLLALRSLHGVRVIQDAPGTHGTWPFFMLLFPDEASRDAALARLWTARLGVSRLFIHALPDYDYLRGVVDEADVPHARDMAARSLTIGNSLWLDDDCFAAIIRVLDATMMQYDMRDRRAPLSSCVGEPAESMATTGCGRPIRHPSP